MKPVRGAGFGVPGVTVTTLPGELTVGQHDGSGLAGGGDPLRGIDGIKIENPPFGKCVAETREIDHTNSRRKLRSTARAEWVMAPEDTKSAPTSA